MAEPGFEPTQAGSMSALLPPQGRMSCGDVPISADDYSTLHSFSYCTAASLRD